MAARDSASAGSEPLFPCTRGRGERFTARGCSFLRGLLAFRLHRLSAPVLLAAALALVTCLVYRPSLGHGPRSDQWLFLLHTRNDDSFVRMLAHSYSFNRTTRLSGGDYPLFRPVLFAFLCGEKALFDSDIAWWQRVGLLLHLGAVGLLVSVLRRLPDLGCEPGSPGAARPGRGLVGYLGWVFAGYFAVNFAVVDAVIWSHINSYILFLIFELAAMRLILEWLVRPDAGPRRQAVWLGGAYACALAGAFTHEIGQFFGVCVGAVTALAFWRRGRRRQAVLACALGCAVLVLYQAADRLDRRAHPAAVRDVDVDMVLARLPRVETLTNAARYLLFTCVSPFVPSGSQWAFFKGRLYLSEPLDAWPRILRAGPLAAASCLIGALFAAVVVRSAGPLLREPRLRSRLLFLLLPAALLLLHFGITVSGRLNLRPEPAALMNNSYYAYLPLMMLLTLVYGLLLSRRAKAERLERLLQGGLLVALVVLGVESARRAYLINAEVSNAMLPLRLQVRTTRKAIRQQRGNPAFRLTIDPAVFHRLDRPRGIPDLVILFGRYIDHQKATHILCWVEGKYRVLSLAEYSRNCASTEYRHLPALVLPGADYNVYSCDGRYYAVRHDEGYYRRDSTDYAHLIQGESLEEVLARMPRR